MILIRTERYTYTIKVFDSNHLPEPVSSLSLSLVASGKLLLPNLSSQTFRLLSF
jgi:hypothetical protein